MGFKYETHCHTARISACSSLSAADITDLYTANGYRGLFITDHFLNGNTTVGTELPFAERIERFCEGYEEVKRKAKNLDVFFGFEFSYRGTDVLCYGWDKKTLKTLTDIHKADMRAFCDFCKENGALAVQAHPFREADYIDHIRLYTNVEGVETLNTARTELCNSLAEFYASSLGKVKTAGSDIHHLNQKVLGGMEFDTPLSSVSDFVERVRRGEGRLFSQPNVLT